MPNALNITTETVRSANATSITQQPRIARSRASRAASSTRWCRRRIRGCDWTRSSSSILRRPRRPASSHTPARPASPTVGRSRKTIGAPVLANRSPETSVSVTLGTPSWGGPAQSQPGNPLRGRHLHRTLPVTVQWITSFSGLPWCGGTHSLPVPSAARASRTARGWPRELKTPEILQTRRPAVNGPVRRSSGPGQARVTRTRIR